MTYGQTIASEITKRATGVNSQEKNASTNDQSKVKKDQYRQSILHTMGQPQQQGQQ